MAIRLSRRETVVANAEKYLKETPWAVTAAEMIKARYESSALTCAAASLTPSYLGALIKAVRSDPKTFAWQHASNLGIAYLHMALGMERGTSLISLQDNDIWKLKFCARIFLEYYDFVIRKKVLNAQVYFKILYFLWRDGPQITSELAEKIGITAKVTYNAIKYERLLSVAGRAFPYLKIIGKKKNVSVPIYDLSEELRSVFDLLFEKNENSRYAKLVLKEGIAKQWKDFKKDCRLRNFNTWRMSSGY